LNRRNALSIDSPWFTVTIAILSPFSNQIHHSFVTLFNTPRTAEVKYVQGVGTDGTFENTIPRTGDYITGAQCH
jgi:hypothetical protein